MSLQAKARRIVKLAVLGYGTYQLGKYVYNRYYKQQEEESLENNNPVQLNKIQKEVYKSMRETLPMLNKLIEQSCDTRKEVKRLKLIRKQLLQNKNDMEEEEEEEEEETLQSSLKEEELQLWERIKVQNITRYFLSIYMFSLLFLTLTVVVNLLASFYLANRRKLKEETLEDFMKVTLNKGLKYLIGDGFLSLHFRLKSLVAHHFQHLDAQQDCCCLTRKELQKLFKKVRNEAEHSMAALYIICDDDDNDDELRLRLDHDQNLLTIVNTSWDVIESPVFDQALKVVLNQLFDLCNCKVYENGHEEESTVAVPLAQILLICKNTAKHLINNTPSSFNIEDDDTIDYISTLQNLDEIVELGIASCR